MFKLLIVVLFHTTGGSDEGQDWECTKVGGYIRYEKTTISIDEMTCFEGIILLECQSSM